MYSNEYGKFSKTQLNQLNFNLNGRSRKGHS